MRMHCSSELEACLWAAAGGMPAASAHPAELPRVPAPSPAAAAAALLAYSSRPPENRPISGEADVIKLAAHAANLLTFIAA